MPVLKNDLSAVKTNYSEFLEWTERPSIGFRGMAAPLKFNKVKASIRNNINLLANRFGHNDIFSLRKNHGYLERRNALVYLSKNRKIDHDFSITGKKDADDENSRKLFIDNVFKNPYTLCVSGFGNFSYRLFETLSAGRIPVFIDTDCKLPFEEFFNWNDYVVWVDRKDIPKTGNILLDFHRSRKGEKFILQQQKNKALWTEYLTPQNFFIRIKAYL